MVTNDAPLMGTSISPFPIEKSDFTPLSQLSLITLASLITIETTPSQE